VWRRFRIFIILKTPGLPYALAWGFLVCTLTACKKTNHAPATNSTVYIGSSDQHLYALDANTGVKKWAFATSTAVFSSPTVYKGQVYLAADSTLFALDTATGAVSWSYPTGGQFGSTPLISGGMIYFINGNDSIYALDLATHALRWATHVGLVGYASIASSPTLYNGTLFIGGPAGWLMFALDASTGSPVWSQQLFFSTPVYSSPCYGDGLVFVGGQDENIYALDAGSGKVAWTFPVFSLAFSSPTLSNGLLYFGGLNNFIYCLDAATGAERWQYTTLNGVYASPVVSNGVLYVGDHSSYLFALDALTGATKWMRQIGSDDLFGGPTVAGGVLYLGCLDGNVYAVDAATGDTKWTYTTGGYIESSPCVTASDGSVYHPGVSGEQD
jgi:eukaryotic-like serine/threonine-protein kinase